MVGSFSSSSKGTAKHHRRQLPTSGNDPMVWEDPHHPDLSFSVRIVPFHAGFRRAPA